MAAFEPRFAINPRFADLAACTALLNGRAGSYKVESYETTLSLKSVVTGSALYRAGRGRFLIERGSFLVLNHGQRYALDIAAASRTETLCVFFQPGFVEGVARELAHTAAHALDEPEIEARGEHAFCERLHPKSGAVVQALGRLHAGLQRRGACGSWLEEQMYVLAAARWTKL